MNIEHAIDTAVVLELKSLLADDYNELVERYVEDSGARMQRIADSIASDDMQQLYTEAHGVKGSSQNIGAHKLAEICAVLEKIGLGNDHGDKQQLFAAAQHEFAVVCEYLKSTVN